MFFGTQTYREGSIPPKCFSDICYVWCMTGTLQVLEDGLHEKWLVENPEKSFRINFGNGSCARINPDHSLWQELKAVAEKYDVYVYVLTLKGGYKRWTGEEGSLGSFDCILIKNKQTSPPKNLIS